MASLEQIVRALEGRSNGHGMCRCPEHKDRNPSLSATERDGQVLVHCHAGCTQEAVLEALGGRGLDIRQPNGLNGTVARVGDRGEVA